MIGQRRKNGKSLSRQRAIGAMATNSSVARSFQARNVKPASNEQKRCASIFSQLDGLGHRRAPANATIRSTIAP